MLIVGDFNSRSGILNDIEETDLSLLKRVTTCPDIYEATDTRRLLEMNDVPLKRSSQDKGTPNALGYQLIDFCKNNDMIILNGRLGSDKDIGKVTSKECSVVDYAIASPLVLPYFRKFEILDFDPIYSDVHCGVSFSIESIQHPDNSKADTDKLDDVAQNRTNLTKANWLKDKSDTFLGHLDKEKLKEIDESLTICLSDDSHVVVQATVDRIVSDLCNVLLESAEKIFIKKSIKICIKNDSKPGKVTKEIWFRKECKDSRRSYRKAKRYYYKLKTNEDKVQYNLGSKQ